MRSYQDSKVILTGANRGIGLALAKSLLEQGAEVWAGVRNPDAADELKALGRGSSKLTVLRLDIGDDASVGAFAEQFRAPSFDLLVNSAGVNLDRGYDSLCALPITAVTDTLNINTVGPLRMIQHFLPKLQGGRAPVIANVSSVMGSLKENASPGSGAYRLSKSALNMLGRTLGHEERGVITLSLHPGWVRTRMGGPNGQIDVETSAKGLLEVIAKARPEHSGLFFRYSGEPIDW